MRSASWSAALFLACVSLSAGAGIIGSMTPPDSLTEARIAAQAPVEQSAWMAYLARSRSLMAADRAALAAERGDGAFPAASMPSKARYGGMPPNQPAAWYASTDARHVADNIVSFQTPAGGWGKNTDRSGPLRLRGQAYVARDILPATDGSVTLLPETWAYVGTVDNGATLMEMRFLARVQAQLPGREGDAYRAAFEKGIRYLLAAQFPNGGYPQVYPLEGGYHDAITLNDDAMGDVMELLGDAAARQGDYAFMPAPLAAQARAASDKALALMLALQVRIDGVATAWCQQYDALTLAPVGARNFEPASLSSGESAHILETLMALPAPSADTVRAVHAGVAWLRRTALRDVEWVRSRDEAGSRLVAKAGAGPLWSRFYSLESMKPIFGDRDRSIHDDVSEISRERRNGYGWFNSAPAKVIEAYAEWARGHPLP